jgi:hypothetical protein
LLGNKLRGGGTDKHGCWIGEGGDEHLDWEIARKECPLCVRDGVLTGRRKEENHRLTPRFWASPNVRWLFYSPSPSPWKRTKFFFLFFFWGNIVCFDVYNWTGVWIQGLTLARQALYHLSHSNPVRFLFDILMETAEGSRLLTRRGSQ